MILTDYEAYLFIKIAPSTNELGDPLDIQMFVLDSQSPEAKENFKFRVLSFCLDALETSNVSQVLEELERRDKCFREVMNRSCYGFMQGDPTPSLPAGADVRRGCGNVSKEGHMIGDAELDLVDVPSLEVSSSKSPKAEEGITLGMADLKVSPPSTASTQDWLDDDFVAKSYLVDSSARSRSFITSKSSAIIGHNNWFDIDYTHWFRFMTTNLPNCIPYQSCFLIKESSTSIVVAFKDTEANPEFLRELGTNAEGRWLVIKLLKEESGGEDENEDSDENAYQTMDQRLETPLSPELVERLENEVRTLIGLNSEGTVATDYPQLISAGYINDVAPPRCASVLISGGNSSCYGTDLSSISGPFLLFKSNVVDSGQMAESEIIGVTELTPEIVSMLEESQKMEIVELFKKLHHKNILHNAVELGNILVYYSRPDCSEHNHEWLNFETFLPIRFRAPLSNSEEGDVFQAPVCFDPKNIKFFQLIDFENSQSITGQNEGDRFQTEIQGVEMMLE